MAYLSIATKLIGNFIQTQTVKDENENSTNKEPLSTATSTPPIPETKKTLHTGVFLLPHEFLDTNDRHPLSSTVCDDLELTKTTHNDGPSMYECLFEPNHDFARAVITQNWKKEFITNTEYLTDMQTVIGEPNAEYTTLSTASCDKLHEIWRSVKEEDNFLDRYQYIEWDMFKHMNTMPSFLQALTFMNIASPVISFLMPIILILLPFVIIKMRGVAIDFSIYLQTLRDISQRHFIGKALANLECMTWDKMLYLLAMFGLYCMQMYQNSMVCYRFYQNIVRINDYLCTLREYSGRSVQNMLWMLKTFTPERIPTWTPFLSSLRTHCDYMRALRYELDSVRPMGSSFSILGKFTEVGYLLRCFYLIHSDAHFEAGLRYSFGFDGFVDNLTGIQRQLASKHLGIANFISATDDNETIADDENNASETGETDDDIADDEEDDDNGDSKSESTTTKLSHKHKNSTTVVDQYYPPLKTDAGCVRNTSTFRKNIIITGPNASGKTTQLKATALNILFSQQCGVGFYRQCSIIPYTHIHSYLNIPDTSGRDSLFQAESRRCKDILDIIQKEPSPNRHFCIFDELYSGTNPVEATKAAYSFLKYISKYTHVDFALTTHYVTICDKIEISSAANTLCNYKMGISTIKDTDTNIDDTDTDAVANDGLTFSFTYKMERGISRIEGAISVMKQMNYPPEILESMREYDA